MSRRLMNLLCGWMLCLAFISGAASFSCPECVPSNCRVDTSLCQHGVVLDDCSCCGYCAQGPGDICGIYDGRCGDGLHCERNVPPEIINPRDREEYPGTCVAAPTQPSTEEASETTASARTTVAAGTTEAAGTTVATTQPVLCTQEPPEEHSFNGTCLKQCSVSACSGPKHNLCSARGVKLVGVAGHGGCQHTSCRACYLLVQPDCSQHACPQPLTKRCLRNFYNCIKGGTRLLSLSSSEARNHVGSGTVMCGVPTVTPSQT